MVTKQDIKVMLELYCLILAKFHMVTKHCDTDSIHVLGLILAKFHMVTKPQNKY